MKFVGLHAHSLSIGDSIGYPIDHFKFVVENAESESGALAITDHGTAISYGYILQAYNEFKKKGIKFKPLFGCELYTHPNLDEWKKHKEEAAEKKKDESDTDLVVENESETKDKTKWYNPVNRRHHLVVIAQNKTGLSNLNKIISESYMNGFYRYPRADFRFIQEHNEGLIISSACLGGPASFLILREIANGEDAVFKALDLELKPLYDSFGPERAYLELQFNKIPEQKIVNDILVKYSKRTGYKLIATADSHYARPEWWLDREIYKMLAQQSKGWKTSKEDLPQSIEDLKCELYPKNGQQMYDSYLKCNPELDASLVKEAIERTYDIAHDLCEMIVPDGKFKLPIRNISSSVEDKLREESFKALKSKKLDQNPIYIERLNKELDIICKKGFANYFLVLKEALSEIQKEYLTGAGRGSGAGSLTCYLLEITKLDPIKHNLLFERFLSENRNEAPDIDNDIEDREGAIQILKRVFGEDNVIAISNFNSLQLKSLVKDIAKFHQIPYDEVNKVTSVMEFEARNKILDEIGHDQKLYVFDFDGAMKHSPSFNNFITTYPEVGKHIKILFKQLKAIGKHAGGIALTDNAKENMPLIKIRGELQTPWSEGLTAKHLEQFGIIKYDFLGLATLRMIRNCIERILETNKQDITFENVNKFYNEYLHPDVINQGDITVFKEIYHKGKWINIFQFTEKKAQEFCKAAEPKSINDISAITSIFRPGPLAAGADKAWVEAVHGGKIKFEHPILEEILGPTRRQLCYQEQFMQLAHKLAGFTLTESDELRKLLVKPVQSLGEEMKIKRIEAGEKFIKGCIQNGLNEKIANSLWNDEILGFISYGFNKSHADSYAYISYQCAYLLYHYPAQWIASILDVETNGNADDKFNVISLIKSHGYNIEFPEVNKSKDKWVILDENTFLAPLTLVKGLGDKALSELMSNAPFKSIEDLLFNDNISYRAVNKGILDKLCLSEALSSLMDDRFENDRHFYSCITAEKKTKSKFSKIIEENRGQLPFSNQEIFENKSRLLGYLDIDLLMPEDVKTKLLEKNVPSITHFDLTEGKYTWFYVSSFEEKISAKGNSYTLLKVMGSGFDEHEIYLFGYTDSVYSNICAVAEISKNMGPNKWSIYEKKIKWIR